MSKKSDRDKAVAAVFSDEGKQAYLDMCAILKDISKIYDCNPADIFCILGAALTNCAMEMVNSNETDKVRLLRRQFQYSVDISYHCFEEAIKLGIEI